MSERLLSARLPAPVTARPLLPLSKRASTASWSIRFSLLTITSGAPRSSRRRSLLFLFMTLRYRSFKSEVAKRPPSSCTIGRRSGGRTGMASMTIHSGPLPLTRKASTTLRRLMAFWRFCPLEEAIVSLRTWASSSRFTWLMRSLIASAPMPPRKYTPRPYSSPKRSFISRKSSSSSTIWRGSRVWNSSQARRMSSICSFTERRMSSMASFSSLRTRAIAASRSSSGISAYSSVSSSGELSPLMTLSRLVLIHLLVPVLLELGDLLLYPAAQQVYIVRPLLAVHPRHDRAREVQDPIELLRADVQKVAHPARHALDEPHVRYRGGELDVAHPVAPDAGAGYLDSTPLTYDALEADPLVLAAVALPVLGRAEDALVEEAVLLGTEGTVVDGLGLGDLAAGPLPDLLCRSEADGDLLELVYVYVAL